MVEFSFFFSTMGTLNSIHTVPDGGGDGGRKAHETHNVYYNTIYLWNGF